MGSARIAIVGRVIRHILFDLDGTLTDSADGITRCIAHAVESLGESPPAREGLASYIGTPLRDIFAVLLDTRDPALLERAVELYRDRFNAVGFAENRVFDGVAELLADLRARGYALYIATAKRQVDAERVADHFGLGRWIERAYGVTNDVERDDKSVLIGRILTSGSIAPESAAMVGDRSHDMRGATRHGVLAVGAGWGYGSTDELTSSGASWIGAHPLELLERFPALR